MSNFCLLNRFPVEIFYVLFDYFVVHELFLIFANISDYIDSIIHSYPNHRLHLRSIRKSQFDLLCSRIRPEHVISLVLSDADDTSGLSTAFLSCYRLEQFTRLQSLNLIDIEYDSLQSILSDLDKLDALRAFSLNEQSIRYPYPRGVRPESFHFTDAQIGTLSSMYRLRLDQATTLASRSFSHLRQLEVHRCFPSELKMILQSASQLRSLTVCLNLRSVGLNIAIPQNRLIELRIEIQSGGKHEGDTANLSFVHCNS